MPAVLRSWQCSAYNNYIDFLRKIVTFLWYKWLVAISYFQVSRMTHIASAWAIVPCNGVVFCFEIDPFITTIFSRCADTSVFFFYQAKYQKCTKVINLSMSLTAKKIKVIYLFSIPVDNSVLVDIII